MTKKQTLNELLEETKAKVMDKDYYETINTTVNGKPTEIYHKLLSHKIYAIAGSKPEHERAEYILEKTLYNPAENKLFTKEELNILFMGLGGLVETIALKIIQSSGFDLKILENIIPSA